MVQWTGKIPVNPVLTASIFFNQGVQNLYFLFNVFNISFDICISIGFKPVLNHLVGYPGPCQRASAFIGNIGCEFLVAPYHFFKFVSHEIKRISKFCDFIVTFKVDPVVKIAVGKFQGRLIQLFDPARDVFG